MHWMRGTVLWIVGVSALLHGAPQVASAQDIRNERIKILPADSAVFGKFGVSVAISGPTAIVGASSNDGHETGAGSAYFFDAATGAQVAKLIASDGAYQDYFGWSVSICGSTAIVGAWGDDDNGSRSGSAYLFDVATGTQIAKLLPSDGKADDWFGRAVATSGSIAIVGADFADDYGYGSGSAYLFDVVTATQVAKLLPNDGAAEDRFGCFVAISGSIATVGAQADDDNSVNSGSAYLFDVATGMQFAKLLSIDGRPTDSFGDSVAISGSTAIVGAPGDSTRNGTYSGSAYLFDVPTATQIAKLLPSDGASSEYFGHSVAICGSMAIVGARSDGDNGYNSGSAYLVDTSDPANPAQIAKLLPSDGAMSDFFGWSVAISGSTAIVGARDDDDNGLQSGSAYLFDADNGVPIFTLAFSGECPGRVVVFTVTNATPGGRVAFVHGLSDGPTTIPITLPCAGTVLEVGNPNLGARIIFADACGVAVLNTSVPHAACGQLRVQALDLSSCETSEVVRP